MLIAYLQTHMQSTPEMRFDHAAQTAAQGPPVTILEIGCGAGGVHQELLRQDVAHSAVGVDASSAYLKAALGNAQSLDLAERVNYQNGDFAESHVDFETADIVIMDRVICCYPHLQKLLGQAAEHAGKYLAISFPYDQWYIQIPFKIIDRVLTLTRSGYHPYLHKYADVVRVAENAGMRLVHRDSHYLWRILVFER